MGSLEEYLRLNFIVYKTLDFVLCTCTRVKHNKSSCRCWKQAYKPKYQLIVGYQWLNYCKTLSTFEINKYIFLVDYYTKVTSCKNAQPAVMNFIRGINNVY